MLLDGNIIDTVGKYWESIPNTVLAIGDTLILTTLKTELTPTKIISPIIGKMELSEISVI